MLIKDGTYFVDFQTLLSRQKGELFCLEGDHLRKMGFGERIWYRLSSSCPTLFGKYAEETAEKVKNLINIVTESLQPENDGETQKIETLYFKQISSLSQRVYSRKINSKTLKKLENSNQIQIKKAPENASEEYITAYKAAKLWAKLGNYQMLNGSSGSYRIFDHENRSFGVCKLAKEEPLAAENPRFSQRLKRKFHELMPLWSKPALFKTIAGQAYRSEVATYMVAQRVIEVSEDPTLKLVPETHIAHIGLGNNNDELSSFQLWMEDGVQTAASFLGVSEEYKRGSAISRMIRAVYNAVAGCFGFQKIDTSNPEEEKISQELFEYLVIVDYLTGNHDRHAENWYVIKDENGDVKGIRLIDGGWSMSPYQPSNWCMILLRHQYLWRKLDLAEKSFSQKAIRIIEKLYEKADELEGEIREFYETNQDEEAGSRALCFKQRLEALYRLREGTKAELAMVRTDQDFNDREIQLKLA